MFDPAASLMINTLGKKSIPPGGGLSVAPTRHWVTCSSNPGFGGIFFLTLAPFLLHLIQSVSQVIRAKSLKLG